MPAVEYLIEDRPPQPQHAEVLARTARGAIRLDLQGPDIPRACTPHDSRASKDAHGRLIRREADPPRVEEPRAAARHEVEQAAALLEEAAVFGEEQGKAIEGDLLSVGLDLGEVGVGRQVQRESARERIADVEADLARRVVERGGTGETGHRTVRARQDVRRHVERRPAPHAVQRDVPRERRLAERERGIDRRERDPLAQTRHEPRHGQAHDGAAAGIGAKADRRERDAHLGEPAVGRHLRPRRPEAVPVLVERRAVVGHELVEAHAGRRRAEPLGVAVVVEGVDVDRERVVAVPAVAVQRIDADAGGVGVVEPAGRVEILVVVGDADLGALCRRAAEDRRVHREGQRRYLLPCGLVRHAVECDGPGEASQRQDPLLCDGGQGRGGKQRAGEDSGAGKTHAARLGASVQRRLGSSARGI